MKCKNCKKQIGFIHYFVESLNLFSKFKHICPYCHIEYKVKIYFWLWLAVLIVGLKTYKYWMQNYISLQNRLLVLMVAIGVIYIIFIIEQIFYYLSNRK